MLTEELKQIIQATKMAEDVHALLLKVTFSSQHNMPPKDHVERQKNMIESREFLESCLANLVGSVQKIAHIRDELAQQEAVWDRTRWLIRHTYATVNQSHETPNHYYTNMGLARDCYDRDVRYHRECFQAHRNNPRKQPAAQSVEFIQMNPDGSWEVIDTAVIKDNFI